MCVVFPYLCAAFLDPHRRALERFVERRLLGEHCTPGCHSARRNRRNCVEGGPSAAARDHSSGGAVVVSQPNRWTGRTVAAWARADRDARTVGRFPRVLTGAAAVAGPRGVHGGGRRRRRRGSARSAQHSSARGGGSRGARLAARWERHRAGLHAEAPR